MGNIHSCGSFYSETNKTVMNLRLHLTRATLLSSLVKAPLGCTNNGREEYVNYKFFCSPLKKRKEPIYFGFF